MSDCRFQGTATKHDDIRKQYVQITRYFFVEYLVSVKSLKGVSRQSVKLQVYLQYLQLSALASHFSLAGNIRIPGITDPRKDLHLGSVNFAIPITEKENLFANIGTARRIRENYEMQDKIRGRSGSRVWPIRIAEVENLENLEKPKF